MEYLDKVLGIKTTFENTAFEHFPNFISTRYHIKAVSLEGTKVAFVYPQTELEQIETLKKHIERIQRTVSRPIVLILNELTFRQKEYLIREKIPFVVDGKQIYLPFMALYLQERCTAEKQLREEILPSAQMLLLHFIYKGAKEISTSQAAKDLELTPTSISRASKQLEDMGLLNTRKIGVQKILFSEESPRELFERSKDLLLNPVKRIVYIPKELAKGELVESGYLALARYTMLNTPNVNCYAAVTISGWSGVSTNTLHDSKNQVQVEMWRYDPRKLSSGDIVDELSLALTLRGDTDERVEEAVEEMLEKLWREIDGYRN